MTHAANGPAGAAGRPGTFPARTARRGLEALGLGERRAAEAAHILDTRERGLTLVTGPCSSGKETTVQAMAARYEARPGAGPVYEFGHVIEFPHPGRRQVLRSPEVGLDDFMAEARAAGAGLVVAGELRTAQDFVAASRAASHSHVVASMHASDVASALARFARFAPPVSFVPRLNLVIAQRLLRRRCGACGGDRGGCGLCTNGYRGRTLAAETLLPGALVRERLLEALGGPRPAEAVRGVLGRAERGGRFESFASAVSRLIADGETTSREAARVFARLSSDAADGTRGAPPADLRGAKYCPRPSER